MVVDEPIHPVPGEVRCPRCFGKDIAPSMPRGWRDALMAVLGRIPRHCRFCERRFYVRPSPVAAPAAAAPAAAAPAAVE